MPLPSRALFLPAPDGQRLCLYHAPVLPVRGVVVYVHPWAEEMNKSRRMAAWQSRVLAAAGFAVVQIDLQGCGDSSGDWTDSSWTLWIEDVTRAVTWLRRQQPGADLWLWGLRGGCLVATQAAAQLDEQVNLLFWQPTLAGKTVLQQFLRLKAAAGFQDGDTKGAMAAARQDLLSGKTLSVAGYDLPPGLAAHLQQAALALPACTGRIVWLEVATRADADLLPASAQCIETWRASGHPVQTLVVQGPQFWQTQEIEDAPALIEATVGALTSAMPA